MQQLFYSIACGATALLASTAPLTASAQSTWNLGGSSCDPGGGTPNMATCTSGPLTAKIWGMSNTGSGGKFSLGQVGAYDPSGFGLVSGANETSYNSQHAFDNSTTNCGSNGSTTTGCGGSQELMLLNFSAAVNLTQMAIGYWGSDADISILRWDGPADGTTNQLNAGNTLQCQTSANYVGTTFTANGTACGGGSSTASGGWTLVSSMDLLRDAGAVTGTNPYDGSASKVFNVNAGTGYTSASNSLVSSWWIISTYNGAATGNLQNDGLDAFKVLSFTANTCSSTVTGNATNGTCTASPAAVPEPGSLALAGLALAGVYAGRRQVGRAARQLA